MRKILLALVVISTLLVAMLWTLFGTESGLRWTLNQLAIEWQADRLQGDLGNFSLSNADVRFPGGRAKLDRGRVKVNWWSLWQGRIDVSLIELAGLKLDLDPTAETEEEWQAWTGVEIPIDLLLEQVRLDKLALRNADGSTTRIERADLDLAVLDNQLYLHNMTVQAADLLLGLRGRLDLGARTTGTVDLQTELSAASRDLTSEGRVKGNWQNLTILQRVSGLHGDWEVEGNLQGVLSRDINWELDLSLMQLWQGDVNEFSVALGHAQANLSGQLDPALGWSTARADVQARIDADLLSATSAQLSIPRRWVGELRSSYADDTLQIEHARLAPPDAATSELNASPVGFSLTGHLIGMQDIIRRITGSPGATVAGGVGQVDLRGKWQHMPLVMTSGNRLLLSDGHLTAAGDMGNLRIEASAAGTFSGTAEGAFSGTAAGATTATDVADDSGIRLGLIANVAPDAVDIDLFELVAGRSRASLNGRISNELSLDWKLLIPDLAEVTAYMPAQLPQLSGDWRASGRVAGHATQPTLQFSAESAVFGLGEFRADQISLNASLSPQTASAPITIDLKTSSLDGAQGNLASQVSLVLDGTSAKHKLRLVSKAPGDTSLSLSVTGSFQDTDWQGALNKLTVTGSEFGQWNLLQPSVLKISAAQQELGRTCLVQGSQQVCTMANHEGEQMAGELRFDRFKMTTFNSLLEQDDWRSGGVVNGELTFSADMSDGRSFDPAPAIQGYLEGEGVYLQWLDEFSQRDIELDSEYQASSQVDNANTSFELQFLALETLTVQFEAEQQMALSLQASTPQGDRLSFESTLNAPLLSPTLSEADLNVGGEIIWKDLARVPPVLSAGADLNGSLQGNVAIKGSLAEPRLAADMQIRDASAQIRPLGLRLNDIQFSARSSDSSAVELQGALRSGDGVLQMEGQLNLADISNPQLGLKLTGESLTLASTADIDMVGEVDLLATIDSHLLDLKGRIAIARANLDLQLPESVVLASEDVVLPGRAETPSGELQSLDLTLDLGADTRLQAQGLNAMLGGQLRVLQDVGGIVRAEGQIEVLDGRYAAYAQQLDIDNGLLIFDGGSIDDPTLDLKAQKNLSDVTAGVRISGRASNPVLELFSDASLSDQDILSVLIFDKSLDQLGSQDGLTLLRIAESLNNNGPGRVAQTTQSIQDALGLSELELDVTSNNPEIRAGKQLSSRFYVGYGYGLLEATQSLILRYKLNNNWSIKADVGVDTGADLRYQIER